MKTIEVALPVLHPGQVRAFRSRDASERQLALDPAFAQNRGVRRKAIRCGRRWGKTDYLKTWIGDGALKGYPCGIFAPDYKRMIEVYAELAIMLEPVTPKRGGANKSDGVIRLDTGGRIDFWTLEDESAGRSRKYKRVGLDESAFTKPNMMDIWKKSIEPTLLDLRGSCVTASNTSGIDPENFLWQVCNQAEHGFVEVHEPSWNNPHVPIPLPGMSPEQALAERAEYYAELRRKTPPLVFAQEYEAEFVDWAGVAFFTLDKWLVDGAAVPLPTNCDGVFATIDTAAKTGSANDGTAVIYWARNMYVGHPLVILDWDIIQIEGDLLETWLPTVFSNLEHFAKQCGSRGGSRGAWIEDKSTGTVLLQQGARRDWPVHQIDSKLTSLGKDERAISVSSYHYQGKCKISQPAYDKVTAYKGVNANHLRNQVAGFRVGDKDAAKRADDLLDDYCYGLALSLGNSDGW